MVACYTGDILWRSKSSFLVWYSEMSVHSLAFKATISYQFWRSEPSFIVSRSEPHYSLAFKVVVHSLEIRSVVYNLAFKAVIYSQTFKPTMSPLFRVQSCIHSLAFKVASTVWCSEPCLQFGIQSHHPSQFGSLEPPSLYSSAFRVIISYQLWHSELSFVVRRSDPPYLFQFAVQNRISSLAFRAIILSRSGIHCHFFGVQSYVPSV